MRQAVILAGGQGTRLRERLAGRPKPLIDICGVPLLERQVLALKQAGYTEIVVLVNYKAEQIEVFCQSRGEWGISVRSINDGEPRGTAGAVLAILDTLDEAFLVVYGDTLFDVDLARFETFHQASLHTSASLFLHPNDHPQDSDLVRVNTDGQIVAFHGYPHPPGAWYPNLVNAALYIVRRDSLRPWQAAITPLDFVKDLFPRMLTADHHLGGYLSSEYIKDAGTPERVDKVEKALSTGVVERASLRHPQRAVFIDRDGTLNIERGYVCQPRELEVYDFVGPALRRLNDSEWRAVVVTNQPVIARGECSAATMSEIHARLDTEVAQSRAFFDRLYLCPHHPDQGFEGEVKSLKIRCDCRKPAPGLLLQAQSDLNIDLAQSWMIGDTTSDLGAAARAGVTSVLVETGAAGLDDRYPYTPAFVQPDFAAAVDFILKGYASTVEHCAPVLKTVRAGQDWFIGGLARSGKSTLAATLMRELNLAGCACVVIALDRWLLPISQRGPDVLERYEMDAITDAFALASDRNKGEASLSLPAYSRRLRERLPVALTQMLHPGEIVIWEGVIAIELARRLARLETSVATSIDEARRADRLSREYRLRGESDERIQAIYTQREHDEHPWVRQSISAARFQIALPSEERSTT